MKLLKVSYILSSIFRIEKAHIQASPIHNICFPIFAEKSNDIGSPKLYVAPIILNHPTKTSATYSRMVIQSKDLKRLLVLISFSIVTDKPVGKLFCLAFRSFRQMTAKILFYHQRTGWNSKLCPKTSIFNIHRYGYLGSIHGSKAHKD